jgi:hypothetical protein
MFKNESIKGFLLGFITYFLLSIILDLFGIDTVVIRTTVFAIIILLGYFINNLYKKKFKS